MGVLKSQVEPRSARSLTNAAAMQNLVDDLRAKVEIIRQGGGAKARERHVGRGKMLPRDRINAFVGAGTPFFEFSQFAAYEVYGEAVPAAGVITGIGRIRGQECVVVAN